MRISEKTGTAFRDCIMLALAGFVAIVILILPHINPPGRQSEEAATCRGASVSVEIRWPDDNAGDVDLWVRAPGDVPVGYSNLNGRIFNLLRDDLGTVTDLLKLNYEMACTRGLPPGEYVVNLHMYRPASLPVVVSMMATIRRDGRAAVKIERSAELLFGGQEITVVRWALDEQGAIMADSIHDTPIALRPGAK